MRSSCRLVTCLSCSIPIYLALCPQDTGTKQALPHPSLPSPVWHQSIGSSRHQEHTGRREAVKPGLQSPELLPATFTTGWLYPSTKGHTSYQTTSNLSRLVMLPSPCFTEPSIWGFPSHCPHWSRQSLCKTSLNYPT